MSYTRHLSSSPLIVTVRPQAFCKNTVTLVTCMKATRRTSFGRVCTCMCVCVCVCVRACVRARARTCVRACVYVLHHRPFQILLEQLKSLKESRNNSPSACVYEPRSGEDVSQLLSMQGEVYHSLYAHLQAEDHEIQKYTVVS